MSKSGRPITRDSSIIGGARLRMRLDNELTMEKINHGAWDVVILQEHFQVPSPEGREKFFEAAEEFHAIIAKNKAKLVLYAAITGNSPVGLTNTCGKSAVPEEETSLIQTAA